MINVAQMVAFYLEYDNGVFGLAGESVYLVFEVYQV